MHSNRRLDSRFNRRRFLGLTGTGAVAAGVLVGTANAGAMALRPSRRGVWLPAAATHRPTSTEPVSIEEATDAAVAIVDDVVDNRDGGGIRHSLHVRGPDVDLATPIVEGPVVQTLVVTFAEPGEYEFFCDTHPHEMSGVIVVG